MPKNIFNRIRDRGREIINSSRENIVGAASNFISNFRSGFKNVNINDGLTNFADNEAGQIGLTALTAIPPVKLAKGAVAVARSKETLGELLKNGLVGRFTRSAFKTIGNTLLGTSALGLARTATETQGQTQEIANTLGSEQSRIVTRADGTFFTPRPTSNVQTRPDGTFFTPDPSQVASEDLEPVVDVSTNMSIKEVSDKNVEDFINNKNIDPNDSPTQFTNARNNNDLTIAQNFQNSLANNERLQRNQTELTGISEQINTLQTEAERRLKETQLGGRLTGNQTQLIRQEVAIEFGQKITALKEYRQVLIQENSKIEDTAYRIAGLLDVDQDNARQQLAADFANKKSELSIGLAQLEFSEKSLTTAASTYTLVQSGYQALLQKYGNKILNDGQESLTDLLFTEFPQIRSSLEQYSRLSNISPEQYTNLRNYIPDSSGEITYKQNFDTKLGQVDVNITTDANGKILRHTGVRTSENVGGFNTQSVKFTQLENAVKEANGQVVTNKVNTSQSNKYLADIWGLNTQ